MKKLLLAGLLAVSVSACATFETRTEGPEINEELVTEIETGVTTRKDILRDFGTPNEIKVDDSKEIYIYTFTATSVPLYFFGAVEVTSQANVTTRRLEVVFKDEKVVSYKYRDATE